MARVQILSPTQRSGGITTYDPYKAITSWSELNSESIEAVNRLQAKAIEGEGLTQDAIDKQFSDYKEARWQGSSLGGWQAEIMSAAGMGATGEQLAAYEKHLMLQAGITPIPDITTAIIYEPGKFDELAKKWGRPAALEAEARYKDRLQYEKSMGLVAAANTAMSDELKRLKAEEFVAVQTRAKDLAGTGVDEYDEYGNIIGHRILTWSEAVVQAEAEREASKIRADPTQAAIAGALGAGIEMSGVALDLIAFVSPTLAAKLRKVVKVTKGGIRVAKLVTPKVGKIPKVKIKKALKAPKKIVKAALKVPKVKIPKPPKEAIAEAEAAFKGLSLE